MDQQSQRKPFQPINDDLDDRMERLAADKGVGKKQKPPAGNGGAPAHAAVARPQTTELTDVPAADSGATPRSRMKGSNLELPDYLWTDLNIHAARIQTTVRHVTMAALKDAGFAINSDDMIEDGQRVRGGSRPNQPVATA